MAESVVDRLGEILRVGVGVGFAKRLSVASEVVGIDQEPRERPFLEGDDVPSPVESFDGGLGCN